jgi:hypothetical protein
VRRMRNAARSSTLVSDLSPTPPDVLKETREKFWAPGPRGYCRLLVRVDDKQVPCPAVRYLLI